MFTEFFQVGGTLAVQFVPFLITGFAEFRLVFFGLVGYRGLATAARTINIYIIVRSRGHIVEPPRG